MQQNLRYYLYSSLCHTFLSLQNLKPTLPTMQVSHRQFVQRSGCIFLVMASSEPQSELQRSGYLTSFKLHTSRFIFHFQTFQCQPRLPSLEGIYQILNGSLWTHKKCYMFFFTYAVVLPQEL